MIRLEMKNCNMILTEKHQRYRYYHPVKLVNTNILQVKKYCHLEQANFAYSRLGKAFEKQIKTIEEQGKKQIKSLQVLKPDENNKDTNQLKDFFQKGRELMKLKMKQIKLKNGKKKLNKKS